MLDQETIRMRTWLLIAEGMGRGYTITHHHEKKYRFVVSKNGQGFTFAMYPGYITLLNSENINYADDKIVKKKLLADGGLRVPQTYAHIQHIDQLEDTHYSFPVVVKPLADSLSNNVFTNVTSTSAVMCASEKIEASGQEIVLEEQIEGLDYRLLVIDGQFVGAVERRAANIVGDGTHTITELIDAKNTDPKRKPPGALHTTLHHLVFDDTSREILSDLNLQTKTVLERGHMIKIQHKIVAGLGADYVDVTDHVHPSIIISCVSFAQKHNFLIIGFDLITSDISKPLVETKGAFNEFNLRPYIDLNENNNIGKKRPASKYIWDYVEKHADRIMGPDFPLF
jgi:cyanophycin synthetase